MQPIAFDNPTAAAPNRLVNQRSTLGFASSLSATTLNRGDAPRGEQNNQHTAPEEARKAAEQLVSSAFLQPMFKQLRNSSFKTGLLDGGQAEQAFSQRLHTRIADRMVSKMDLPMVEAVTRYVTQNGAPSNGAAAAPANVPGTEVNRHG